MPQVSKFFRGLLGCLLLLCLSCENENEAIDAMIYKEQASIDRAVGVTFYYSERGKVVARLFTKQFTRNERIKPVHMDMTGGLFVEFFNDTLGVDNTLSAKRARYYEEAGNVLVRDSIIVVNSKGETLRTEELVWNKKLKKFYTDKAVSIQTPTQVLYGDGLEASEDFSSYQIKNIRGSIQVDKSKMAD